MSRSEKKACSAALWKIVKGDGPYITAPAVVVA